MRINLGKRGASVSAGIPGTGVFFNSGQARWSGKRSADGQGSGCGGCLGSLVVIAMMAIAVCAGLAYLGRRSTVPRPASSVRQVPSPVLRPESRPPDEVPSLPAEKVPDDDVASPAHEKAESRAAARLRIAQGLLREGKKVEGRRWLQRIVDEEPNTEAAEEAAKLLK